MNGYAATWELTRGRFDGDIAKLSTDQLRYRLHPGTLTMGEMAMHVAGVEASFISQLEGRLAEGEEGKRVAAATDGVVNTNPFPYSEADITAETVAAALAASREMVARHIYEPAPEILARTIKSALGPMIDGAGAFARLAYHSGYHQGQLYMISSAPDFPRL